MTANEILFFDPVNPTDPDLVNRLVDSIQNWGWMGAPLLVCSSQSRLITGSHRLKAIKTIMDINFNFDPESLGDIAVDVSRIVEGYCKDNNCTIDRFPFDCLRLAFEGTFVQRWQDQLEEW